jgi:hypothetical protein
MPRFYARECYGKFGVFAHKSGRQVGSWFSTLFEAQQAARLLNEVTP